MNFEVNFQDRCQANCKCKEIKHLCKIDFIFTIDLYISLMQSRTVTHELTVMQLKIAPFKYHSLHGGNKNNLSGQIYVQSKILQDIRYKHKH